MKLVRILITVIITLAVIFVGVTWVAPVALSFYAAKRAPAVTRIVPIELKDNFMSGAPGQKLSYFGYEFEVPWTDLDETQTKLYPKDKPEKNRADLRFHSGLRLVVTAIPPHEWERNLADSFHVSPQTIESAFGHDAIDSDYRFVKALYEFTPDKMRHWGMSLDSYNRDQCMLIVKSIAPLKSAESGIFNLQNPNFKGFQQGNPQPHQDGIAINLYSDEGSIEMIIFQKDYKNGGGVTQPEINRIVQSLHKASPQAKETAQPPPR